MNSFGGRRNYLDAWKQEEHQELLASRLWQKGKGS
jgi:hypothetical protein